MQSRLGMGQEAINFAGAAAKFGRDRTVLGADGKAMGEGEKQSRFLMLAVEQGTKSGLAKARIPEFLNAQTAIMSSFSLGQKGDQLNVMGILTELGQKGFKGDQGVGAYKGMQAAATGGKTELGRAIALKVAGWGNPGVSYADATMNMEEAGRTMTPAYFNKLVTEYRRVTGGDEGTARMKMAENMGMKQKEAEGIMRSPFSAKALSDKDVQNAKKTEDELVRMGDLKTPIDDFQKKSADTFEKMFESESFQTSMKTITDLLGNAVSGFATATQTAIDAAVASARAISDTFGGAKDFVTGKTGSNNILNQVREEQATAEAARVQAEFVEKQRMIADKNGDTVDEFGKVIKKFSAAIDDLVLRGPGDKGPTTKKPSSNGAVPAR
jgi:hypothetical protein